MRQPLNERKRESRANALWGRGGGKRAAFLVSFALLILAFVPAASFASNGNGDGNTSAFVPSALRDQATQNPDKIFDVVVRGKPGEHSASIATYFVQGQATAKLKKQFYSIAGVAGSLSGADLLKLADNNHVLSIFPDQALASTTITPTAYVNQEVWRSTTGIASLWGTALVPAPQAPAIAIVDSGVDATKTGDFGSRVVASVNFCSTCTDGAVDDQGHGTMVAGLAAGANSTYTGAATNAPIVNLRTADANGSSKLSDVLSACDWILANAAQYNIKVANFSMVSSVSSSFRNDPLDGAVESLWFHNIVVVAAVGNYGNNGSPVQIAYAPGNDPFVISVGALDTQSTAVAADDTLAPWSAFGHTLDGFAKPEISAPGRWLIAPVPMGSTLPTNAPDRVMAPGYMWMSGTSLAAPIVAGAAAQILAAHPSWTAGQVKGTLMKTATRLPLVSSFGGGVGELNAAAAAALAVPSNPHSRLDSFITTDATGKLVFNGASWANTVQSTPGWSATDWSATDWSATDWSATDWSCTDWSASTNVAGTSSATTTTATDWSATDWSATDWSASLWSP
jgi:serine protease AprX